MRKHIKVLFLGLVFSLSVLTGGVLTSVVMAEEPADAPIKGKVTSDPAEAKEEAGYDIVEPGNIPEGMARDGFMVSGIKVANDKARNVHQLWLMPEQKSQWIIVTQGPESMGLINGAATTVSGVAGERVAYESRENRPEDIVALYWPSDGGHLGVVGSIFGDQNEDTLRGVAGSLISR